MLKIGITGNIGSGKTTVSKIFAVLGIPVFYADDEAKKIMVSDEILIDDIKKTFGEDAYFNGGALNRKYIAGIVFNNEAELAKLNAIVHPAVFRGFDKWALQFEHAPYVLKEAALLFESNSYKMCRQTILVTAPLPLRIKRVLERDSLSEAEVMAREARQLSEEKKRELANYVIVNDDKQLLVPQVLALHQKLLEGSLWL